MKNFEERHGDSIICPYCKEEQGDMWEVREDEGIEECPKCSKKFYWRRRVEVEYITNADCELNNEKHNFIEPNEWMKHSEGYEFKICECSKCSEYESKIMDGNLE